jgi:hypothetical protein
MTRLMDSVRRGADQPEEWRNANKIMATTAWLTAGEVEQAVAEIGQVLDKYSGRGRTRADRPDGTRQARLFAAVSLTPSAQPDD